MARILVIHCEFDTERPLGPQIVAAIGAGLKWKTVQAALRRAGLPHARSYLNRIAYQGAREPGDNSVHDTKPSRAA